MTNFELIPYKCPMCQQALTFNSRSLQCDNRHCFDIAKESYVNLLLPQHKRSRDPGDNDAMVKSRQHFLNQGYYRPLADAIANELGSQNDATIIDIGCGEGYYLNQIKLHTPEISAAGVDISKHAVKLAAKRKMGAQLAVASAFKLPFFNNSFDIAVSVFSPIDAEETARILKPGAQLITVGPGGHHLQELAALIYDTPQKHQGNKTPLTQSPLFKHLHQCKIDISINVRDGDIFDLLTMTPYYWTATETQQQSIKNLTALAVTLSFEIDCYTRAPSNDA